MGHRESQLTVNPATVRMAEHRSSLFPTEEGNYLSYKNFFV